MVQMDNSSSMIKFVSILILTALFYVYVQANQCPQNGRYQFYPSVNSSSSFFGCLSDGTNTGNYTCPEGQAYRPRTSMNDASPLCVPGNSQYGSGVFICNNSSGNGSYSGDQTLYVECQDGQPITIQECPQGEFFIESIQQCNLTCAVRYKIGSFALANGSYYNCSFNFGTLRWNLTTHTCPGANEVFSESYQFCLPELPIQ